MTVAGTTALSSEGPRRALGPNRDFLLGVVERLLSCTEGSRSHGGTFALSAAEIGILCKAARCGDSLVEWARQQGDRSQGLFKIRLIISARLCLVWVVNFDPALSRGFPAGPCPQGRGLRASLLCRVTVIVNK